MFVTCLGCRINEDCRAGEFCSRINHICLPDACSPLNPVVDGSVTYLNGIAFLKCLDQVIIQGFPNFPEVTETLWELVVMPNQKHWIILLFNIIKILNKLKIFFIEHVFIVYICQKAEAVTKIWQSLIFSSLKKSCFSSRR